jgi:hypothetical protein
MGNENASNRDAPAVSMQLCSDKPNPSYTENILS